MKIINNSYPIIREAKVINTSDPEKLGRVQLKVCPELTDIPDSDCPWCFPNDGGIHGKSFRVPLVGSTVNCIVWSKYWNEITYLPFAIVKPTEHLFEDWIVSQKSKINDMKDSPEEEHFIVEQFENNFSIIHDTKNGQHGILHPSGTYILIDKQGGIHLNSKNDLKLKIDGDTTIESSTVKIDSSDVIITGGTVTIAGTASPTGSGPFCGIPNCLFTGAPHVGDTVTGT